MLVLESVPETKTICADCLAHLVGNPSAERISHGICGQCYKKYCEQIGHCPASVLKTRALICGECGKEAIK